MGSLIWNLAKQHRSLIQQHNFWEVKNGNIARFWEDSWQQMPKLKDLFPHMQSPPQNMQEHDRVKNFWKLSSTQEYKEWLKEDRFLRQGTPQAEQMIDAELKKMRIQPPRKRMSLDGDMKKNAPSIQERLIISLSKNIL